MTNYPNVYLPSVYLSFSSDTHIVHINLSKCEAMCYVLLQKIIIHSLNFLYAKIGLLVSTNVLQYIFIPWHLVYTLFTCMCLIVIVTSFMFVYGFNFLWRIKLTFIVVLMICQLWSCAYQQECYRNSKWLPYFWDTLYTFFVRKRYSIDIL